MASPAEVVRSVLLKAELVVFPGIDVQADSNLVLCFVNQNPDQPDLAALLYDKQGTSFGRDQETGKYDSHPGVKLMVRASDASQAYDVISSLCLFLAARTRRQSVPIRDYEHFVASIHQVGDVISLGEDPGTRRSSWAVNLQVAMEDVATAPLE